jgi:hypothetical protein
VIMLAAFTAAVHGMHMATVEHRPRAERGRDESRVPGDVWMVNAREPSLMAAADCRPSSLTLAEKLEYGMTLAI